MSKTINAVLEFLASDKSSQTINKIVKENNCSTLDEGKRLIKKIDMGEVTAKVYKDNEWEEYVVQFYKDGIELKDASYHTDDLDDALSTTNAQLTQLTQLTQLNKGGVVKEEDLDEAEFKATGGDDLDPAVRAYLECALWADGSKDNTEAEEDATDINAIDKNSIDRAIKDVGTFKEKAGSLIDEAGLTDEQVGHDFWLTRNGHGAGFWDRGLGDIGDKLTELAHKFGQVDVFVDDKEVFIEGYDSTTYFTYNKDKPADKPYPLMAKTAEEAQIEARKVASEKEWPSYGIKATKWSSDEVDLGEGYQLMSYEQKLLDSFKSLSPDEQKTEYTKYKNDPKTSGPLLLSMQEVMKEGLDEGIGDSYNWDKESVMNADEWAERISKIGGDLVNLDSLSDDDLIKITHNGPNVWRRVLAGKVGSGKFHKFVRSAKELISQRNLDEGIGDFVTGVAGGVKKAVGGAIDNYKSGRDQAVIDKNQAKIDAIRARGNVADKERKAPTRRGPSAAAPRPAQPPVQSQQQEPAPEASQDAPQQQQQAPAVPVDQLAAIRNLVTAFNNGMLDPRLSSNVEKLAQMITQQHNQLPTA